MPTLRQRFLGLAGTDVERWRRYRCAWLWARQRLTEHEIHVDGSAVRLFPTGGLEAAAAYGDAEVEAFVHWVVFAYVSYIALI